MFAEKPDSFRPLIGVIISKLNSIKKDNKKIPVDTVSVPLSGLLFLNRVNEVVHDER